MDSPSRVSSIRVGWEKEAIKIHLPPTNLQRRILRPKKKKRVTGQSYTVKEILGISLVTGPITTQSPLWWLAYGSLCRQEKNELDIT